MRAVSIPATRLEKQVELMFQPDSYGYPTGGRRPPARHMGVLPLTGWTMAHHIRAELPEEALKAAAVTRGSVTGAPPSDDRLPGLALVGKGSWCSGA